MRDLKRHTSEMLHNAIAKNKTESRKEWMLQRAAAKNSNAAKFQLWQAESHAVELYDGKAAHQKLAYIHNNLMESRFVSSPEHWTHSSAIDYNGGKGLLKLVYLDPLVI